jgi:hypothetical protein
MARQIKKPVVYRRHEIDPSGTGVRCVDVAPIPEEAPSASANTESDAISALREEVAELRKEVARHRSFVGMHTPLGGDSARF